MSVAAVRSFHEKLQQDVSLQDEMLESTNAAGSTEVWHQIAQKYGFSVTQDDVVAYLDSFQEDEYEFSDFELELVAAGAVVNCSGGMG